MGTLTLLGCIPQSLLLLCRYFPDSCSKKSVPIVAPQLVGLYLYFCQLLYGHHARRDTVGIVRDLLKRLGHSQCISTVNSDYLYKMSLLWVSTRSGFLTVV